MAFGGYAPYPRRFGVGRSLLQVVHEALNAARGSALTCEPGSIAWVENMAYARALVFDGHGTTERLGNQRDPDRMTDMLSRWETIFGINPTPGASGYERRREVRKRFRRFLDAAGTHSRLYARLTQELGSVFVQIEYQDPATATIYTPDATYPYGTVQAGHPWYSTVCHILVRLTKPTGYTEGDFYAAAAKVLPATDGMLPAWVAISWYRSPATATTGFYLDVPANLDNFVLAI